MNYSVTLLTHHVSTCRVQNQTQLSLHFALSSHEATNAACVHSHSTGLGSGYPIDVFEIVFDSESLIGDGVRLLETDDALLSES